MEHMLDGVTRLMGDSIEWISNHPQFLLVPLIFIGIYLILFYNR